MIQQTVKAISTAQKIINFLPYVLLIGMAFFVISLYSEDLKKRALIQLYGEENQKFREKADSVIKKSNELTLQVKSLEEQAEIAKINAKNAEAKAQKSEKIATNLKHKADSLAKKLTTAKDSADILLPLKDQIIIQQDVTIKEQKNQISDLNIVIEKKENSILLLTQDNQNLKKLLTQIPVVDKCADKIIFCKFNKPSRKTSFVAGFATATALTLGAVLVSR